MSAPVSDKERSRRFYGETMGLPRVSDGGFPEYQRGENVRLCHMAIFRDPDGNEMLLHRRYAP